MAVSGMTTDGLARLITRCVNDNTLPAARPFFFQQTKNGWVRNILPVGADVTEWIGNYEQGHQIRWLIYRSEIVVGCYTKVSSQHWSYHTEPATHDDLQA